ncbi:putative peptidase S54, rhomboid [Medicago truncatula]|uniref:RHOMBOID-like protein n=1 Tax=Medicago truncatula TaxID=3880 RepID=G7IAP6_MEDTR|nr:RHOMBOID-like protein 2 [Medicago truncatula]AES62549.2 inactive rhomboid-like protein [Medicago truncatula]RHN81862.1 putative peptidase S54, rhomboid [Medicago truncatula]
MDNKKMNPRRDVESGRTKNNCSYVYVAETHRESCSWLVPAFVFVNIVVFIVVMGINNCPNTTFGFHKHHHHCVARFLHRFSFQPFRENPLLGPSSLTLIKMGALRWVNVVHQHQEWRLFTCIWLHAGIIHLLSNMLCLVLIGIRLEQQFGFVKIGLIYLLSGFGGSVFSSIFIRNSISVGASSALFGLLGAMISELLTNWTIYSNKVMALLTLLVMIAINLTIGLLPRVDNLAHIGGLVVGFLLGFILLPRPQYDGVLRKSKYNAYQFVLGIVSLVLLTAGLSFGLVMLFRGENGYDHCHWCHYLTCVPSSRWECNSNT